MTPTTTDTALPTLQSLDGLAVGRFTGREHFQLHIRDALQHAAQHGWAQMIWSDPDFYDWPLGERAVIDMLNLWVRQGRSLILLAHRYDAIARQHPRFVRWRGVWDHKISCRRCLCTQPDDVPSMLWSASWVLHRLNVARCVGLTDAQPQRSIQLREVLDEWLLRRSTPAFAATTLGL